MNDNKDFINCVNCNSKIPASSKFCPECGEKIEIKQATSKFCSECGTKSDGKAKFCLNCGNKL